jgi:hypothetical protein
VLLGAMLSGDGTLTGTLLNHGTVAPGGAGSLGRITVQGNYTQSGTGSLTVELGATDGFDQLATNGSASLNGRLNIRLLNGFEPPLASTYDVVTAQALGSSGSFSSVDPPPSFNLTLPVAYPGGGTTAARITTEPPIPTPVPQPWVPPAAAAAPAVIPEICKVAPTSMACQLALSPSSFTPLVQSIVQTVNSVVTQVPSSGLALPPRTSQSSELTLEQVAAMPASIPAAGSSGSGGTSTTPDDSKNKPDEKKDEKVADAKVSVVKNAPPPKAFCN